MSRYGDLCKWRENNKSNQSLKKSSLCWRDINLLGSDLTKDPLWFNNISKLHPGQGDKLKFWRNAWCGPTSFSSLFMILYQACTEKIAVVRQFGQWTDSRWAWNWAWFNDLSAVDIEEEPELKIILQNTVLSSANADKWVWEIDNKKEFSVKTC